MGECAILCEAHDGLLDLEIQKRIWALTDAMESVAGIVETVPGMNNLLLVFDPSVLDHRSLKALCVRNWADLHIAQEAGRCFDIPTVYGGEHGEDLIDSAELAGMSVENFVTLHAAGSYTVYALGSQPGFAYLGGLDPRLTRARRQTPRARVEAGSVVIGGSQAGVISRKSPSGWHIIGRTPVQFFDPANAPPALLTPGDTLRFKVEAIRT